MSQLTISRPHRTDIPAISALLAASWRHAYRGIVPQAFLDQLTDNRWEPFLEQGFAQEATFYLLARRDSLPVGAAVCRASLLTDFPHDGELVSLYLLPDELGRGTGHRLITDSEAWFRQAGFAHCVLDVLEGNSRAIRFYEAHGYRDTGHRETVNLGGADLHCQVMRKTL